MEKLKRKFMEKLKKLEKFLRSVGAQALRGVSLRSTIVLLMGKTLKALSLNSRGYAARRTYGNRMTVQGMHAEGVPQQRGWATPSGSMFRVMHFDSIGRSDLSVGRTDPRLLIGDRVAVIGATPSGSMFRVMHFYSVGSANPRLLRGDRVAVIRNNLCGKTFVDNFDRSALPLGSSKNFVNFDNFKK